MTKNTESLNSLKSEIQALRAILNSADNIQLRDGTILDIINLQEMYNPNEKLDSVQDLIEKMRVPGGGTGHGG